MLLQPTIIGRVTIHSWTFSPPMTLICDDEWVGERKEWTSSWPCFSDRTVSPCVLAGRAAGMLAGRHYALEHLPSHLPLPDEWKPQPVLQNLHPTAGKPQYLTLQPNVIARSICPMGPYEVISLKPKILSKWSVATMFYLIWIHEGKIKSEKKIWPALKNVW